MLLDLLRPTDALRTAAPRSSYAKGPPDKVARVFNVIECWLRFRSFSRLARKAVHSRILPACRSFDISQMRALFWSQSAGFFGFGRKTPLRRPTAHAHQSSCWRRSDREMAWGFERGCLQRLFYLSSSESSKGLRRSEPNTFSISRQRISSSSNDIVSIHSDISNCAYSQKVRSWFHETTHHHRPRYHSGVAG